MVDFENLMPEFSERLRDFVMEANYQGIACDVFCGYRSPQEQDKLYAQGRGVPGTIITDAPGGKSWHNWGVAADVVPLDQNGQWTWDVPDTVWKALADIADAQGLEWGGAWSGNAAALGDTDHFQLTAGLKIGEAMALNDMNKVWDEIRNRMGGNDENP